MFAPPRQWPVAKLLAMLHGGEEMRQREAPSAQGNKQPSQNHTFPQIITQQFCILTSTITEKLDHKEK